jgi:hypothetical protein
MPKAVETVPLDGDYQFVQVGNYSHTLWQSNRPPTPDDAIQAIQLANEKGISIAWTPEDIALSGYLMYRYRFRELHRATPDERAAKFTGPWFNEPFPGAGNLEDGGEEASPLGS